MGFELHAQNFLCPGAHLIDRFRDLHAAAFAAAAGVDLRLHYPDLAAELLRRVDRLVHAHRGKAARRRHAVFAEDLLALVLVDFHAALPLYHFGYQTLTVSLVVSSAWHWSSWNGLAPSSPSSGVSPAKVWIAAVGSPASSSVRCVQPLTLPSRSQLLL